MEILKEKVINMSVYKISLLEATTLILIVTVNRLAISIPQAILLSCGSSAILNTIYVSLIAILLTYIIVRLFRKFPDSDIIDVSEFLGGKFLKYVIGTLFFIYIVTILSFLLRDFIEILRVLYYTDTPIVYLLSFFIVVCIIANLLGSKSIVKTNVILCIIMIIGLLIAFSSVIPNLTIQRIFPILGYGSYTTFFSGLTNILAFNGLSILYLVPPMLNDKKDLKKASMIAVSISAILIILATSSMLLAFSFSTNIEKISPLYTLLSNNEFEKYFQHPESLFVFTWILSFMSYINVACLLLVQILKKLTNVKNGKPFIFPICIAIIVLTLLPRNMIQAREFGNYLSKYFATPITFIVFPLIMIFANLKYKKQKGNGKEEI